MATRMQQRRGTAAQWTAANPILAAGEIGFETDTSKFKMGNGSSTWSNLTYFANATELAAIVDGAPAALNTLNELAEALGDNPAFLTEISTNLSTHATDTTLIHGIEDTALLATTANVEAANQSASGALSAHAADTTLIHGITDTSLLATTADITAHNSDTTSVHGIADTSLLATTGNVATAAAGAATELAAHAAETTSVHGIADTSLLATTGNVSTAKTEAIADAATAAGSALTAHNSDTTDVHGIVDTTVLVTQTQLTDAVTGATVNQAGLAGVGLDYNTGTEAFDIDSTVATKTYADNAVSTHQDDTTSVHGIADTSLLATTADVAAVTKSSLGLGSVDNTADASKPVSTAQAAAIAAAQAAAISDATSQVNALITGAPAAMNTLDELAAALGDDENFAASVTASLGLKVDSVTPISQKTASYTLSLLSERDDLIEMGSSSAITLTIPTNATVAWPVGTSIDILQTGTGQVTVAGAGGVTVNATPGLKLRTQYSSATLFKRAENTWVVFGDLTA